MSFARDSGSQQQQPQQNENPRQQQVWFAYIFAICTHFKLVVVLVVV